MCSHRPAFAALRVPQAASGVAPLAVYVQVEVKCRDARTLRERTLTVRPRKGADAEWGQLLEFQDVVGTDELPIISMSLCEEVAGRGNGIEFATVEVPLRGNGVASELGFSADGTFLELPALKLPASDTDVAASPDADVAASARDGGSPMARHADAAAASMSIWVAWKEADAGGGGGVASASSASPSAATTSARRGTLFSNPLAAFTGSPSAIVAPASNEQHETSAELQDYSEPVDDAPGSAGEEKKARAREE